MKRGLRSWFARAVGSCAVGLLALGGVAQAGTVDRIAAVVNDDIVTLSEIYDFAGDFIEGRAKGPESRRAAELEVLDSLIERRLIAQEMERLGIDVAEQDIDRAIDDVANRNQIDRDVLRREVEKTGMNWSQYRDELRESLRQQQFTQYVMQTRISVDEDELKDAWRRKTQDENLPEIVDLGGLLLLYPDGADDAAKAEILARAQAVVTRIQGGEDFLVVSAEVDQGGIGGRMGEFPRGQLVATLDDPAFATPVGQPSEPIITDRGVFVLYPFSRKRQDPAPYDEMRDELEQEVYAERVQEEVDQWVAITRRQSAVVVKLEQP